jgi:hypothetical protein
MGDKDESLETKTIYTMSYIDLKVPLLGTISPIRLGQGVFFPRQAMRQTAEYTKCIN